MSVTSLTSCASGSTGSISTTSSSAFNDWIFFDKCPKCFTQFDSMKRDSRFYSKVPLILNCKHVFCEDCIRSLIKAESVTCPMCTRKSTVPQCYVKKLTDLFVPHYALMGYLMWTKSSFTQRKPTSLVSTGVTLKNRHLMDMNPNDLVPLKVEGTTDDGNSDTDFIFDVPPLEFEQCPEHNGSFRNVHCTACDTTVCCYCFLEDHGGHTPLYLYKLEDEKMSKLQELQKQAEMILHQLHISKKKIKELKSFDLSRIDNEMRNHFSSLHAKLHFVEKQLRENLPNFKPEDVELEHIELTIKSAICRVTQTLSALNSVNARHVNMQALFQEIESCKDIPCRLVSNGQVLEPIKFVSTQDFENLEECFTIQTSSGTEYNLIPVDNWDDIQSMPDTFCIPEKIETKHVPQKTDEPVPSCSRPKAAESEKSSQRELQKVIITHWNSLDSFFIQKCNAHYKFKTMNKFLERRSRYRVNAEKVAIGQIYGVLYVTKYSNTWRRGKVIEIIPNSQNMQFVIFYVDFGNNQRVSVDKLIELDLPTLERPPFAIECKLSNPDGTNFDANAHLHLAQIIRDKEIYLKTVKKLGSNRLEVDLLIPNSSGDVVSATEFLSQPPQSSTKELKNVIPNGIKFYENSKKFSKNQEEMVVIVHIEDPFSICVQLRDSTKAMDKMKNELKDFFEKKKTSCVPVEDSDVIVNYRDDFHGNWHRARILSVDSVQNLAEVFFVDWGYRKFVPWSAIRMLSEYFTKIECQAIKIKLADIEPGSGKWSQKAIDYLKKQLPLGTVVRIGVSNIEPLEVALFKLHSESDDICINALLAKEKLCISTGSLSSTEYWPHQGEETSNQEEDDGFTFQLIKKSEEVIMSYDDPELKMGVNQEVTVIRCDGPDLIYIQFMIHRQKQEQLQKELQIHYNSRRKQKKSWKPSDCCVVYDFDRKKYYRGEISSEVGVDSYRVYLYDDAKDLVVQNRHVYIYEDYFKTFQCYTYKCCLANIRPAGDSGKWPILAKEILQKIFSTFKTIYVKKADICTKADKLLNVIMWYSLRIPGSALEPTKFIKISINKTLIECGVAFGISKSNGILGKSADTNNVCEEPFPPHSIKGDVEISDSKDDKQDNEELIFSECDLSDWPKLLQLTKTEFDALLICVDNACVFSVRDKELEELYLDLETTLKSTFDSAKFSQERTEWRAGEMCTIHYEDMWYRGTVLNVENRRKINVEMIDFGSEHIVNSKDLYKQIMYPDLPPLIYKVQLHDVFPKNGEWNPNDLDELLAVVKNQVKVVVVGKLNADIPFAEVYLEDGASVNDEIVKKCSRLTRSKFQNTEAVRQNIQDRDEPEVEEEIAHDSLRREDGSGETVRQNVQDWDEPEVEEKMCDDSSRETVQQTVQDWEELVLEEERRIDSLHREASSGKPVCQNVQDWDEAEVEEDMCDNSLYQEEDENNAYANLENINLETNSEPISKFTYFPIPKSSENTTEMFIVTVLKYDEVILNIANRNPAVEKEEFLRLNKRIQEDAKNQSKLQQVQLNSPCICFQARSEKWYRAIIYNIDSMEYGYVYAFFVDYGVIDMIPLSDLREMRPEWFDFPIYNRIASVNIEQAANCKNEYVLMQLNNWCGKSCNVEIISTEPLRVHLYDKDKFIYQKFIDCGIIKVF